MKKQISIIIRNKNNSNTIVRALDSALNQSLSLELYQIIVVDDGSTDDSIEKLLSYSCQIELINTQGIGAVKALNLGIHHAHGSFFTILDSDDELPNQALEYLLNGFSDAKDAAAIYGNYREISTDGTIKKIDTSSNMFSTIAGGILFKKKLVVDAGCYDESLFFPEYDLLIKLAEKYSIVHIPEEVYSYFRQLQSITANREKVTAGIKQINQKYGKEFPIRKY